MPVRDGSMTTHEFFSKGRFDGADQHRLRASSRMADGIEATMKAIDEIDIRPARRAIQGSVSCRFADESVTGRITQNVSLRFHNRPTARAIESVPNQEMA